MKRRILKKLKSSSKYPCEICKIPNILVEHHIRGRKIVNSEHPSNKCLVCSNCHVKIHTGLIVVERWISTTTGKVLEWHLKGESSFTGDDSTPYIIPS